MLQFCQKSPYHLNLKTCSSNLLHSLSCISSCRNFNNLAGLLQGRIPPSHLLQIHARVIRVHAHQDNLIATRLIGHYPSRIALRVFNQLKEPNLLPFNAIIRVLADEGQFSESFSLFRALKQHSVSPNDLTFSFILKACFRSKIAIYVRQIHTHTLKTGFISNPYICNGMIAILAKVFKDLVSARKLFDEMPERGLVSCWTSLIAGCAQSGHSEEVLRLFSLMINESLRPEDDTMVSVLSACSNLEIDRIEKWVTILSRLVKKFDSESSLCDSVRNVLVYLFGKWGKIEKSREIFDEIADNNGNRSVLPWNSMINAYVQNGLPLEALNLFRLMVKDPCNRPNHVTIVSVLSACAQVGDLELGGWVHEYMKTKGSQGVLQANRFLATALIDMYSKCGSLDKAREVFDQMVSKDVVSFNAMIMGFATNGEGREAVNLFFRMQECGLHPNAETFLGLLWASLPLPRLLYSSSSSAAHQHHRRRRLYLPCFPISPPRSVSVTRSPRNSRSLIFSSSNKASSFDEFAPHRTPRSADKKSVLSDLIQEIEPLDVSLIQRDVPSTTLDAMKRTISGMLGLLPSDRFEVFIEALWEALSKLLVSSMMTGYTLRNAEYRLCLERNLNLHEGEVEKQSVENSKLDLEGTGQESLKTNQCSGENEKLENLNEDMSDDVGIQVLNKMSPKARQYILNLQSRMSSVKKELHKVKRKSAALQMQQFVGEEKNDLLDYLRSLQSEKVAELSEPTSPELKETINSVVHSLLATLSPKMDSKAPPQSENTSTWTLNNGSEDCAELVENTSLHLQPLISLTRDYLARLLFWFCNLENLAQPETEIHPNHDSVKFLQLCMDLVLTRCPLKRCMLLGHYLRGLECRMELIELLSLTTNAEADA